MYKYEIILRELNNGNTNIRELSKKLGMSESAIRTTIETIRRRGIQINNFGYAVDKNNRSPLRNDLDKYRKEFFDSCGFYPSEAWLARKCDCSRERIRQISLGIIKGKENYTAESFSCKRLSLHRDFLNEIDKISEEMDVTRVIAIKIFSYRWAMKNKS